MTRTPTRATPRRRIPAIAATGLLLVGTLGLGGCYAYHEVHRGGHPLRHHHAHGPWCAAEHGHRHGHGGDPHHDHAGY